MPRGNLRVVQDEPPIRQLSPTTVLPAWAWVCVGCGTRNYEDSVPVAVPREIVEQIVRKRLGLDDDEEIPTTDDVEIALVLHSYPETARCKTCGVSVHLCAPDHDEPEPPTPEDGC